MARNRMIKPEFWEDEKVAKLSFEARLLFLGLLNFADDKGYIRNNPIIIKAKIFPYENFGVDKICNLLQELFNQKMILEQNNIIKIKNFLKHQIIEKPSKKTLENEFENQCEIENSRGIVGEYSPNNSQLFTDEREVKEKLKEVKEKEKEKEKESKPVDNFQKPTQTKTADFEKAKAFGETPNPLSSFPNQNDKTAETTNDQLPNDKTATAQTVPKNYRELIDYLIANFAYPREKAKLVANRAQTDKFELNEEQFKSFANMDEKEIVLMFDTMAKIKNLQRKSKYSREFERL